MKRPTARRVAGWALLSLVPATIITLAAIAGQLAAAAIGTGIGLSAFAAVWGGLKLAFGDRRQP